MLSAGSIPSGPVLEFHTDREQPSSADVCCPSASPIADSSILSHMPLLNAASGPPRTVTPWCTPPKMIRAGRRKFQHDMRVLSGTRVYRGPTRSRTSL